jgi:hypothetical protein
VSRKHHLARRPVHVVHHVAADVRSVDEKDEQPAHANHRLRHADAMFWPRV